MVDHGDSRPAPGAGRPTSSRTRAFDFLEQWRDAQRKYEAATDPVVRSWLELERDALMQAYVGAVDRAMESWGVVTPNRRRATD